MTNKIIIAILIIATGLFAGCSKGSNSPKKNQLPITVDFAQIEPGRKSSFTLNGIKFQSGGGDWRKGNCALKTPASPIIIYKEGFMSLTGPEIDYTLSSSLVADVSGIAINKVTVKMYARDAYDRVTLEPLPSAYITLCNDGNMVAETREMKSQTTASNGGIIQTWELDAGGATAKRLIISSDDADVYSITIE